MVKKEHISRKNQIFQSAKKLFEKHGFKKTSIDEIVQAAKVAKGTFYIYFPSKESIYEKIVMDIKEEGAKCMQNLLQTHPNVKDRLLQKFIMPLKKMQENPIIKEIFLENPNYLSKNITSQAVYEANKDFITKILGDDIKFLKKDISIEDVTHINLLYLRILKEKLYWKHDTNFWEVSETFAKIIVDGLFQDSIH
ncbi:hypothetical protein COB57_04905 [Candidatus Peregrinibacteria bacterium]|nr:MAG: hypothetical protein COB57_04905 [Candidatus Peregrinibacteria bacterium]